MMNKKVRLCLYNKDLHSTAIKMLFDNFEAL